MKCNLNIGGENMRTLWICLVIASFMLFAVNVSAQDYGFRAGDRELILIGSGSSDEDFDNTVLNAEIGLGYFFTDTLSLALRQGVSYRDVDNGDIWNGSTRLGLDLHIPTRYVIPYIGVNAGYLYGDAVNDQFIAGPEAGIKIFANPSSFIFAGLEYQILFESADDIDDQWDDGRFVYQLGIGMVF